jgi:hypothetical protein
LFPLSRKSRPTEYHQKLKQAEVDIFTDEVVFLAAKGVTCLSGFLCDCFMFRFEGFRSSRKPASAKLRRQSGDLHLPFQPSPVEFTGRHFFFFYKFIKLNSLFLNGYESNHILYKNTLSGINIVTIN